MSSLSFPFCFVLFCFVSASMRFYAESASSYDREPSHGSKSGCIYLVASGSLLTSSISSMSFRLSRTQSLLRVLPSQPFKRSLSGTALLRAQSTEQTQPACAHARRFGSTNTDGGKVFKDSVAGGLTSIADIEVGPVGSGWMIH